MAARRTARLAGQHRSWTSRQRSAEQVARDIAASIRASAAAGITRTVEQYSTNVETIALVNTLLKG